LIVETRERIVGAAERVMRTKGLARATTKEIARAAGYSEGTLYKHFEGKEDLFLSVLRERLPNFVVLVRDLPERSGRGTVRGNLEEVASAALAFYDESVPMAASVFSEPKLLARHREGVLKRDRGPHKANEAVAAYLRAEQHLERVRRDANPEAAAALLLGACYQRAFHLHFLGEEVLAGSGEESFVEDIVQTLMQGLSPKKE
jgi:AcrR family transcriptional regulator